MAIADKLQTIAENEQKVYEAGYNLGYPDGFDEGYEEGYFWGHNDGIEAGKSEVNEIMYSIIGRTGTELNVNASRIGSGAFYNWTSLIKARLPLGQQFLAYAFRECTALTTVDVGDSTRTDIYVEDNSTDLYFATQSFYGCTALETLILRPNIVAYLQGITAFSSACPIRQGTGYIYVPSALVDSYKAATNWSTVADQIRAIEDYPEITGGAV